MWDDNFEPVYLDWEQDSYDDISYELEIAINSESQSVLRNRLDGDVDNLSDNSGLKMLFAAYPLYMAYSSPAVFIPYTSYGVLKTIDSLDPLFKLPIISNDFLHFSVGDLLDTTAISLAFRSYGGTFDHISPFFSTSIEHLKFATNALDAFFIPRIPFFVKDSIQHGISYAVDSISDTVSLFSKLMFKGVNKGIVNAINLQDSDAINLVTSSMKKNAVDFMKNKEDADSFRNTVITAAKIGCNNYFGNSTDPFAGVMHGVCLQISKNIIQKNLR